jgi:MoxR-like ATPase
LSCPAVYRCPGEAGTPDIFGTNIIVEGADGRQHFQFQQGPISCHILIADDINRLTRPSCWPR